MLFGGVLPDLWYKETRQAEGTCEWPVNAHFTVRFGSDDTPHHIAWKKESQEGASTCMRT